MAEPITGGVKLTWQRDTRETANPIEGYHVERRLASENAFTRLTLSVLSVTLFTDSLPDGTTADYRILSVVAGQALSYSQVITTTAGAPAQTILVDPSVSFSQPLGPGVTTDVTFSIRAIGPLPDSVVAGYDSFIEQGLIRDPTTRTMREVELSPTTGGVYTATVSITAAPNPVRLSYVFAAKDSKKAIVVTLPAVRGETYTTGRNNRVANGLYPDSDVLDLRNKDTRDFIIKRLMTELEWGYDGEFLDEFFAAVKGVAWLGHMTSLPQDAVNSWDTFAESYNNQGLMELGRAVKQAIGPNRVLSVNPVLNDPGAPGLEALAEFSNGVSIESLSVVNDINTWLQKMNTALKAQSLGMAIRIGTLYTADEVQRTFFIASYFLANDGRCYAEEFITPQPGDVGKGYWELGQVSLDLGAPRKIAPVTADGYLQPGGWYERSFEHGIVYVNPSDAEVTVDLHQGFYYQVHIGTTITSVPISTPLTLPARTAAIITDLSGL